MRAATRPLLWRAVVLGAFVAGLATSPFLALEPSGGAIVLILGVALAVLRPRGSSPGALAWLVLVAAAAVLAGLWVGAARLGAIDGGRLAIGPGEPVELRGTVASSLRTSGALTRFLFDTPQGRIAVETEVPPPGLDEGRLATLAGVVRDPAPWEQSSIERAGAGLIVHADFISAGSNSRGGLRGALDDVRRRAERALERGTPPVSAALLRGFVLGQDDRIPDEVREEFRRSGLAHVLAVSGQNIMLLALLATPLLALAGVPLRTRLVAITFVIAIYVPVAGAGASIQRAGVMGIAGLVAALASRPSARWYALGLAAAVTLTIDPRATADIGWQLSFAAVAGLLLLSPALIRVLAPDGTGGRRAFAEGAAITLAASVATSPLVAHHFGTVSLTAIPANLLALPAIAPAMWLGMLAGAVGQIPGAPTEPLTWLGGLAAGFIGWVARIMGQEGAQLDVAEPNTVAVAAWTGVLVGATRLACLAVERRRVMRPSLRGVRKTSMVTSLLLGVFMVGVALAGRTSGGAEPGRPPLVTLTILDVGQGDSILVEPRAAPPLLIDTGPPEAEVGGLLADRGVNELSALIVTHDERDHSGGLAGVLDDVSVGQIMAADRPPAACAHIDCPPVRHVAEGARLDVGRARLEVLWPPANMAPVEDPNESAIVLGLTTGKFEALLTADAEAEAAPYESGPIELLKLAHHGSADGGLETLLERTSPQLAAISVGAGNPYGHPAPETVDTLSEHGVPALRTDQVGDIVVEIRREGWSVRASE